MPLLNKILSQLGHYFLKKLSLPYYLIAFVLCSNTSKAQLSYNASVAYSLNKINTAYTGSAVKIRRACDNATINIGFNSCGNLDTLALNAFAGLHVFPLNSITSSAATAYSLRKINCSYTGPAIRIRSTAVGSPTIDIGFTINGDLDTASMKAFIGTNSAYVNVWYDQSGNGRNGFATTTATNQPRMMLAGKIEYQGTRPAIRFLGSNGVGKGFATANLNIYGTAACFNGVVKVANNVTYNCFINQTTANIPGPIDHYNGTVVVGNGTTYSFYYSTQTLNASYDLGIWTYQASGVTAANIKMWHNSTNILTTTVNSVAYGGVNKPLYIGTRDDFQTSIDGWISEAVTFSALPSNTDRNFLEWTQARYYGITGVSLGTLPAGTLPTAFVDTWNDQSGNAKDLSQTTLANQPRIINKGIVEKQNTIPAIFFNGTSNYLAASDAGLPTGNLSISAIVKSNAASYGSGVYGSFLHYGTGGAGKAIFGTFGTDANMGTNSVSFSQYSDAIGIANSLNANLIYSSSRAASSYTLFKNGGSSVSKTMTTNTTLLGTNGFCVGAFNASVGGNYLNGYISEISIFPSAISNTRRILIESNRSALTGITITNNKYTPPGAGSYNLYVNGIGRQSNTDTVLGTRETVGMGIKSGRVAATDFLQNDGDYITYGIDCPLGPATSSLNLPGTVIQRWENDWYLNKTDVSANGGKIKIYFDFSDYGYLGGFLPGVASNYELIYRNSSAGTFAIVAGTTKGVVGDRVEFDIDASLIANGYYTIGTKNTSASPLPIELLNFNATPNTTNNSVNISWETASESNNDYFTIEKSNNAIDFEILKTVNSKGVNGNSVSHLSYQDIDSNPFSGTSYYRLKQTDFNGTYKYSNIVDVNFSNAFNAGITVYPNPNQGTFTLNFSGFKDQQSIADITILNAIGQKVYEKNLSFSNQENSVLIMPSDKLAKGFYFLSCVIDDTIYTQKIVVN